MENRSGDIIYRARKAKGLSQEHLAKLLGVSRQTISQWENDKFQPSNENIDVLCQVLDLSREELIGSCGEKSRRERGKLGVVLISVLSVLAVIMTLFTILLGPICLTDNTGDMMDNSYSIPQYVFFVFLAVSLCLILSDLYLILWKIKEKTHRQEIAKKM